jgi:hypothetical protein
LSSVPPAIGTAAASEKRAATARIVRPFFMSLLLVDDDCA